MRKTNNIFRYGVSYLSDQRTKPNDSEGSFRTVTQQWLMKSNEKSEEDLCYPLRHSLKASLGTASQYHAVLMTARQTHRKTCRPPPAFPTRV